MADVKWIKVATDMFEGSRKIKQIEMMPKGDTILVIWLKLLLLAGNINDGGAIYVTPDVPYTMEMLAAELRRPKATVKIAMELFEQYGMVCIEDGIIRLTSWEKHQNVDGMERIRKQTRERVARSREKKKEALQEAECNVECSVTVTHCNAIEEEGERRKRNSFIHSCAREEEDALLVTLFSVEKVKEATDEEREQMLAYAREREKRYAIHSKAGKGVVMLSDAQMEILLEELSEDEFEKYVGIVAEMELSGKRYRKKNHFQAIMEMAKKDREV